MRDAQGRRTARDYLWFALLLIVVLATAATHSPTPARIPAQYAADAPQQSR